MSHSLSPISAAAGGGAAALEAVGTPPGSPTSALPIRCGYRGPDIHLAKRQEVWAAAARGEPLPAHITGHGCPYFSSSECVFCYMCEYEYGLLCAGLGYSTEQPDPPEEESPAPPAAAPAPAPPSKTPDEQRAGIVAATASGSAVRIILSYLDAPDALAADPALRAAAERAIQEAYNDCEFVHCSLSLGYELDDLLAGLESRADFVR